MQPRYETPRSHHRAVQSTSLSWTVRNCPHVSFASYPSPLFFIDGKRMRGQSVPLRVKATKLKHFIASRSSWMVQSNESATISVTRPSRRARFVRAEMTLAFVRETRAVRVLPPVLRAFLSVGYRWASRPSTLLCLYCTNSNCGCIQMGNNSRILYPHMWTDG